MAAYGRAMFVSIISTNLPARAGFLGPKRPAKQTTLKLKNSLSPEYIIIIIIKYKMNHMTNL